MKNLHTVIVPGVGGSEAAHWQSWLQTHVQDSSRVMQKDWNKPVLSEWVNQLFKHIQHQNKPIQIVAHSFGCLTTVAMLNQYPILKNKIDSIILVAPANPIRFNATGFGNATDNLSELFNQFRIMMPALMIISENDPWLSYEDALEYATQWQIPYINQGRAGHINVASGFGAWPDICDYMHAVHNPHDFIEQQHLIAHEHFRFAI